MSGLHTIKDERTIYCRTAMKAHGGQWNPITTEWMFSDANDHANALCELYRVTRPSIAVREAIQAMISDGTGALAWGFDPSEQPIVLDELDRAEASRLLAAGYAVRRVLGVHPLNDEPGPDADGFGDSTFQSPDRSDRRRSAA